MTIAFFAGSFDPVTHAHMGLIASASKMFETLIIGIGVHHSKKSMFSIDERKDMILNSGIEYDLNDLKRENIIEFDGLLVDVARKVGASVIVRGLRTPSDFDYEIGMVDMNKRMAPEINTVFLTVVPEHRNISSSLVRQISQMGGDISPFVSKYVTERLQ